MIFELKTRAPVLEEIVTLWVFAASLFRKWILKARPAATLRVACTNIVSFASSARVTKAGVARGVGVGDGFAVAVGFGVGDAAGFEDADAAEVGVGEMAALGSTGELAGGLEATGAADAVGEVTADAVGDGATTLGAAAMGVSALEELDGDPAHAATSKAMAIRQETRMTGTAAL